MQQKANRRVLCVVMDGVGERDSGFGNAVATALTPNLDKLRNIALFTKLKAHGKAVGLPTDSDIGNSEVGHNALGSGRVFAQGAKLVNEAIASGSIFRGDCWQRILKRLVGTPNTLHFLGLLSDGNVHSHENHLYQMLKQAKQDGIQKVRVHVLFDGRDVGQKTAEIYIHRLEQCMGSLRDDLFDVRAASGGGRMHITMDRYEADWGMVERGWNVHVHGKAAHKFKSLTQALTSFREDPKNTDQYIPDFVLIDEIGEPQGKILNGDAVVFYNFRGDRSIEISRAFTDPSLDAFDRGAIPEVFYAGMMEYDGDLHIPQQYLVSPPLIDHTLSETMLQHQVRMFACSETQKYGHVTFFWNGNRSGYLDRNYETYLEIPSDEGITFDVAPKMKAKEITDATIAQVANGTFDFGRINYPNGDMVGHTGNFAAAVKAVEAVDHEIGRLMEMADKTKTILVVTADHGNADEMYDAKESDFLNWHEGMKDGPKPKTSHTLSPVPLYIYDPVDKDWRLDSKVDGKLANVANTVLTLMGLPVNDAYLPGMVKK